MERIVARLATLVSANWLAAEALGASLDGKLPAISYGDINAIARDLLDERAAVARLTAEVERLRGVMEGEIEWLDGEAMRSREQEEAEARLLGVSPSTAPMAHFFNRKDKLRAALALPTPAPEAKE